MQRRPAVKAAGSPGPSGTEAPAAAVSARPAGKAGRSKQTSGSYPWVLIIVIVLACFGLAYVGHEVQLLSMVGSIEWSGVIDTIRAPYRPPQPSSKKAGGKQAAWTCADDDGENVARLLAHMRGFADVSNVELGYFKGVRGLKASRAIPKGQPVVSVPFNATLSIATTLASAEAATLTTSWKRYEDADMHLDTLALLYESFIKGPTSSWAPYICTIPRNFDLPFNQFREKWSSDVVNALPELLRLLSKRETQVSHYEALVKDVLPQLPGGQEPMLREKKRSYRGFHKAHTWAYLAAKTRTITLDLEEVAANKQQVPLAPAFKSWLQEFGVLVPVFDLANHASSNTATTHFAVDFSQAASAQPKGSKPVFRLVAARDIAEGEQITFSYLPDDDEEPNCNMRWLVEYGFIISDNQPARDCVTFNATAHDLAHVLRGQAGTGEGLSKALAAQGMPAKWGVNLVRGSSQGLKQLLDWVAAAGVDAKVATCLLLDSHAGTLRQQLAASEASQELDGSGVSLYLRGALLEVLRGAVRAVEDALRQQGCRTEHM